MIHDLILSIGLMPLSVIAYHTWQQTLLSRHHRDRADKAEADAKASFHEVHDRERDMYKVFMRKNAEWTDSHVDTSTDVDGMQPWR